jgi:hypothetical protein
MFRSLSENMNKDSLHAASLVGVVNIKVKTRGLWYAFDVTSISYRLVGFNRHVP